MAVNLLEKRRQQAGMQSGQQPINLLRRNKPQEAPEEQEYFYDLSPKDQEQTLGMAAQKISQQHPNIPNWLRDALLKITPKDKSPMLESAANGISAVTDYIPAAAGGALQGASIPIRGVASMIPTEFTQKLANSPDLRDLFPQAHGTGQKSVQMAAELLGGGGLFGKLMQGVKGASALAKVPEMLQTPLALGGAGYIATPGNAKDKLLGAGGALALGGAGNIAGKVANKVGDKIPEFMRGLTTKSTPEALVQAVQKPHDKLQSTADELYGQVRGAIKKRGIKIPVRDEHLEQVAEILPKTRASRQLIEKAKGGDYDAVHDLQSHLYKKGTKGLASDDIALENQGEEILDLRDKINDDLEKHLLKEGHIDVAHVLKQGKKTVAQLKNTYFAPLLRKGVGKMVQNELRLVPKNPEKLFDQNSVPMKAFLDKHPEVAKHLQGISDKKKAHEVLKKLMVGAAGTGGSLYTVKTLNDLFK